MVLRRDAIKIVVAGTAAVATLPLLQVVSAEAAVVRPAIRPALPSHFTRSETVVCVECARTIGVMQFDEMDNLPGDGIACGKCWEALSVERDELEDEARSNDDDDDGALEELQDETTDLLKQIDRMSSELDTLAFDLSDRHREQIRDMLQDIGKASSSVRTLL